VGDKRDCYFETNLLLLVTPAWNSPFVYLRISKCKNNNTNTQFHYNLHGKYLCLVLQLISLDIACLNQCKIRLKTRFLTLSKLYKYQVFIDLKD
jgi:hypothetical protein